MRSVILLLFLISCQNASAQFEMQELKSGTPGIYKAETTYPHFRETSPLTRLANSQIGFWAKRDQADFIKRATSELGVGVRRAHEEITGKKWNYTFEYQVECRISIFRSDSLISVLCTLFEAGLGVHPMTSYQVFTFGTLAGQERVLTLSDFFRVGTGLPNGIGKVIIRKLKNPEGNSVGHIELNDNEVNKFVVEPGD